eukprot:scaffold22516_cov135-Isochrysis_galbana.AAC.2
MEMEKTADATARRLRRKRGDAERRRRRSGRCPLSGLASAITRLTRTLPKDRRDPLKLDTQGPETQLRFPNPEEPAELAVTGRTTELAEVSRTTLPQPGPAGHKGCWLGCDDEVVSDVGAVGRAKGRNSHNRGAVGARRALLSSRARAGPGAGASRAEPAIA